MTTTVQTFYPDRGWIACDMRVPGVINDARDARDFVRSCKARIDRKLALAAEQKERAARARAAMGWRE